MNYTSDYGIETLIVYHGSPYQFDSFDLTNIGTGSGASLYGHGIYLTDTRDVANEYATYRFICSVDGKEYEILDKSGALSNITDEVGLNTEKIRAHLDNTHTGVKSSIEELIYAIENGDVKALPAFVYDVTVSVPIESFIDMDKSMREQTGYIISAAKSDRRCFKATGGIFGKYTGDQSGHDYWLEALRVFGTMESASEHFKRIGISGFSLQNRHGMFRESGATNYVVFDTDALRITGREDIIPKFSKKASTSSFFRTDNQSQTKSTFKTPRPY